MAKRRRTTIKKVMRKVREGKKLTRREKEVLKRHQRKK